MVSRISIRIMGEADLVKEVRDEIRRFLESKEYYELAAPRKEYEVAGKGNARMYIELAKRIRTDAGNFTGGHP